MMSTPVARTRTLEPPGRTPVMKDELEQLRQRGLTKRLNKHFTEECKKVEAELAAAEAALAELEARKANMKKFEPSSNELTQLDMLCMKVTEWKKQCRQNEQETVMLYARYCEKFGDTVELAKPEDLLKTSSGKATTLALANIDVHKLVEAFDEAKDEDLGIPHFLRATEASSPSSFDSKELEEIFEDASLPDPEAPCKTLSATPQTAATDIDSDLDESSIVSGLTTLNSAVTREVLHDVENRVLDFIKNETENIRKMMEEDAMSKAAPSVAMSQNSASQIESVAEHEDMVKKMQQVLDDFKKAEEEAKMTNEKAKKAERIQAGADGEEWYQKWDETFNKYYYFEAKSNRTQWHMPPAAMDSSITVTSLSESQDSASVPTMAPPSADSKVLFQEFMPEVSRPRSSRVQKFRAKRRKQRNRRLVASAVVLAMLGGGFLYCKHSHPEEVEKALDTVSQAMGWASISGVQEEPKKAVKARKKKSDVPVDGSKKTGATKKKETRTSSLKQSVRLAASNKVTPPEKKDILAPTPIMIESTPPVIKETVLEASKDEFKTLMERLSFEAPKKEPVVENSVGFTQPRHWLLDVLVGHHAFKTVNIQCRESDRYCGAHRHY